MPLLISVVGTLGSTLLLRREAAEQRMHELELEFSATKAEAAAARERARQVDNVCRGAIVKTESQARGRVEIEVCARPTRV